LGDPDAWRTARRRGRIQAGIPASSAIPATTNRVYLPDAALPHMVDGRIYVLNAAYLSLKGMLEAGFAGMMLFGSDKHCIYYTARQVGLWHDLAHVLGRTFWRPAAEAVCDVS
jgi:hypothetical protein